tara:strand:+ start:226138 stop:226803 length:666 start_codon:yes stop_codon:yes gene_type:complete
MRKSILLTGLSIGLLIAATATATTRTVPIASDLTANGWKVLAFDGIPQTQFTGTTEGVLEVRADRSSSVLYRAIDDGPKMPSELSWSWQVIDALPSTDLNKTDGDDRVLALHIGFADDSFMSRLKGTMSPFARGRVLTYVWGGARETSFAHPHLPDNGFMIIRRTASTPSDTWFQETVDLAADYQRAFGEAPPSVAFVGVSGDADDIAAMSFGKIKDIEFK